MTEVSTHIEEVIEDEESARELASLDSRDFLFNYNEREAKEELAKLARIEKETGLHF